MARMHPLMDSALPLLPADRPVHLLTRHSVREEASNGFADYRLALTEEGVRLAREWGASLPRPVVAFYSSPVGRCVDTALAMREGGATAGLLTGDEPLQKESVLVEPGCYVEDVARAGPLFFQLGAVGFINRHLEEGIDGVLSPAEGRGRLVRHLLERNPDTPALAVHVTHDTILAAFTAGLRQCHRISGRDWPWMLEGAWLWFADDRLHWIWRGQAGDCRLTEIL